MGKESRSENAYAAQELILNFLRKVLRDFNWFTHLEKSKHNFVFLIVIHAWEFSQSLFLSRCFIQLLACLRLFPWDDCFTWPRRGWQVFHSCLIINFLPVSKQRERENTVEGNDAYLMLVISHFIKKRGWQCNDLLVFLNLSDLTGSFCMKYWVKSLRLVPQL